MKRDRHFAEVNFIKRRRRDGRSGETSETGKDDRRQRAEDSEETLEVGGALRFRLEAGDRGRRSSVFALRATPRQGGQNFGLRIADFGFQKKQKTEILL